MNWRDDILLPVLLFFAVSLINKKIMGKFVNSKGYNYITWGTIIVLTVLTTILLIMTIVPGLNNGVGGV